VQRHGRKLVRVSLFPFDDDYVQGNVTYIPLVPLVTIGTGLHLELDNETTFCAFGMRTFLGKDSIVQVTCVSSRFYRFLFPLLSFFGEGLLTTQRESPTTGGLGFVVLGVYCEIAA